MEINFQAFKEPRGFIKLLQWLFAICAFATTVDYSGTIGFEITCKSNNTTAPVVALTATAEVDYPFNLDRRSFTIDKGPLSCGNPTPEQLSLIANAQSESVFFVFTGVISFLYATVMIAVYLLADKVYMENRRAPLVDFFITVMLAVFWIAGASAWAHGVSSVKDCIYVEDWVGKDCFDKYICSKFMWPSTSKLVVSVLFGFINFVLWSGNIWFLYKETANIFNGQFGSSSAQTQTSPGH